MILPVSSVHELNPVVPLGTQFTGVVGPDGVAGGGGGGLVEVGAVVGGRVGAVVGEGTGV